jgi:hypothetical protein
MTGFEPADLFLGKEALFLLSYIRMEPSAGFAPAPSSLPRKRPDSGTARACSGAFGPTRTGCLPFTRRPLYLVSYEGIVSSVRFERTLPATHAGASCRLGYEDIGAAVRCRPGPPALRGRGRSRARRHGFRGWARTSEVRGQGPAGDTDAPPGIAAPAARHVPNRWQVPLAPSGQAAYFRAEGGSRTRSRRVLSPPGQPIAFTSAWCAARGSNSVLRIKGPVHHPSCLRRAERHAGVEPCITGVGGRHTDRCVNAAPWFPEDSNLVPAALHAAALPGELENHGRACRI